MEIGKNSPRWSWWASSQGRSMWNTCSDTLMPSSCVKKIWGFRSMKAVFLPLTFLKLPDKASCQPWSLTPEVHFLFYLDGQQWLLPGPSCSEVCNSVDWTVLWEENKEISKTAHWSLRLYSTLYTGHRSASIWDALSSSCFRHYGMSELSHKTCN